MATPSTSHSGFYKGMLLVQILYVGFMTAVFRHTIEEPTPSPPEDAHFLSYAVLVSSSFAVPALAFGIYWFSGASNVKSASVAGGVALWGFLCYLFMTNWQYSLPSPFAAWCVVLFNLVWPAALVAWKRDYFVGETGLSMEMLTLVQSTRFMGTLFILENSRGATGTWFAYTAGFGDFMAAVIGVVILVQLLSGGAVTNTVYYFLIGFGLFDFEIAVSLSMLSTDGIPYQITQETHLMTAYPLALLPYFLVPFATAAHIAMLLSLKSEKDEKPNTKDE